MATRVRIGTLWIDALTFAGALDAIERLLEERRGGSVFTPNIDHVVNAERDGGLRAAYGRASLSLVDGQPVVWASRLLGTPLPEKVSGSDLATPLMERAVRRRSRVYLLGGPPGVAEIAAERLRKDPGVVIAGAEGPRIGVEALPDEEEVIERVRAARPDLVVVGLGAPKQERFIDRAMQRLAPAVCLGLGATIEFIAGTLPRAPRWLSRAGLEWAYRLAQDPRRLARRYLWNDPRFLGILLRTLREPKDTRVSCSR